MDAAQVTENLTEIEGQSGIKQEQTVDLRLCQACSAEMRDRDKFCRRCGVRQTGEISPPQENTAPPACATSRLQADAFRGLSASLLTTVAKARRRARKRSTACVPGARCRF